MPLTDVKCRQAKPNAKAYKLADSGGLCLVVKPNGTKLWWYRYKLPAADGRLKENTYSIGAYPDVTLQEAREARDKAKLLVKQGRHPAHERQVSKHRQIAANENSFEAIAREWLDKRRNKITDKYADQIITTLERDVFLAMGHLPIQEAATEPGILIDILQRMDERGAPVLAIAVRQWCSAVFRYGIITRRCNADPAAALKGLVERGQVNHARPIGEARIRELLLRLKTYKGHPQTIIAIRLLLYIWLRTVEVRRGEWLEIDFKAALWTIPPHKMKKRRTHLVPLPRQAVALLKELRKINARQDDPRMFPNTKTRDGIMSSTTVNRALEHMGFGGGEISGHDFRATASTLLHERGYRSELIEMQLAHLEKNKTKASYNHAQYLAERRQMLQEWADWIDSLEEGRHG